jgi:predicted Zn-dependent peptidase
MYKKVRFDNGLRIIMHRMPDMQSVALGILINIGGRYESFEKKGISHFFEHLVFKGTKEYTCRKIKESIEGAGGSLNGFTSEELTCYLVKIPSKYLELALDVLSSMAIEPLLPESEVKREKTVILEEIKMYKDQPQSYVYELLDELLWPVQPLGAPVIGTVESVSGITREDLRSFKQEHYTAQNIVVSAAGLLDYDKFKKIVSEKFSHLKKKKANVWEKAKEKQESAQLKILDKDTEQTHMALGFHSFRRDHPLRHALGLLHVILGANMSSRLFNEIREKRGLAYEIGTSVKRFQDTGVFIVHAGIDNTKVSEAIKLILQELKKCKNELVNADEFRRAKEFYLGQLMLALEDTLEHMLWIGECTATLDKTYSLKDILKEVNKISRQDIRQAAKFIFKNKGMNLALIGPLKDRESRIRNQLKIN